MSKYAIVLTRRAKKQLDKLNEVAAHPILKAIERLADNPRPQGYLKLHGIDGYRIRVGDYRIIYDIFDNELVVEVIEVSTRQGSY